MYTIKNNDGWYLVNHWNKHKAYWIRKERLTNDMLFSRKQDAKSSLTKLCDAMPDEYAYDTYYLVNVETNEIIETITTDKKRSRDMIRTIKREFESRGYNVEYKAVKKNNVTKGALSISNSNLGVACIVYEEVMKDMTFDEAVKYVEDAIKGTQKVDEQVKETLKNGLLDNVIPVVYQKDNKNLKDGLIYKEWNNLIVAFRAVVGKNSQGTMTTLLTSYNTDKTADELFELAYKDADFKVIPMARIILEMQFGKDIPDSIDVEEMHRQSPMWVVTNDDRLFGAAGILKTELFRELAEKEDSDLIILPSSIHELIVITQDTTNDDYYINMVDEINNSEVDETDRLATCIYKYSRETDSITAIY